MGKKHLKSVVTLALLALLPACVKSQKALEDDPGVSAELSLEVEQLLAELTQSKKKRKQSRERLVALGPEATPALVSHFDSPEFTVRWEIANILGITRDPAGVDALVDRVLHDDNPHIRWRSLWALANMPDATIPDRFRKASASADPVVRWNAAVGGSMFGVQEALPLLQQGVASTDTFKAWEAVNAMGRLPDPSSVVALRRLLDGSNDRLRREAVLVLGKLSAYTEALDTLLERLGDADQGVRWRVALALTKPKGARIAEALRQRLEVETDPNVRKQLEKALRSK